MVPARTRPPRAMAAEQKCDSMQKQYTEFLNASSEKLEAVNASFDGIASRIDAIVDRYETEIEQLKKQNARKRQDEKILDWMKNSPDGEPFMKSKNPERDWPEDANLENGQYSCRCYKCGNEFVGYKRRIACKICATEVKKDGQE